MNLFFVSYLSTIEKIIEGCCESILTFDTSNDLIICDNWLVFNRAQEKGIQGFIYDDILDSSDCTKIDNYCLKIAKNWYKSNGIDFTLFYDISLGSLCEFEFLYSFLFPYIKFLFSVRKIIEKYSVDNIISDYSKDSMKYNILLKVSYSCGVKLALYETKSDNQISILFPIIIKRMWKSSFKRNGEYIIGKILNLVSLLNLFISRKSKYDRILFLFYRSMLPLLIEFGAIRYPFMPIYYKRFPFSQWKKWSVLLRVLFRGTQVMCLKHSNLREIDLYDLSKIECCWQVAREDSKYISMFVFESFQINDLIMPYLENIIKEKFKEITKTVLSIISNMKKFNISLVALPNDATAESRMIIGVARKLGIKSVVLQHGLPFMRNNDDGKTADLMVTWTEKVNEIYNSYGVPMTKLVSIGNPGADVYFRLKGKIDRKYFVSDVIKRKYRVLLITYPFGLFSSFYAEKDPEIYLFSALEALSTISLVNIIIKINPSESLNYYKLLLKKSQFPTVRLFHKKDISSLIANCDLIIAPESTTIIEACTMGKPVICLNVTTHKIEYGVPANGKCGIPVCKNSKELRDMVCNYFVSGRFRMRSQIYEKEIVRKYLGIIDGKESARVLNYISLLKAIGGQGI